MDRNCITKKENTFHEMKENVELFKILWSFTEIFYCLADDDINFRSKLVCKNLSSSTALNCSLLTDSRHSRRQIVQFETAG